MKAITVRQPWAWAIVHGGKDVENRTRNIAGAYRGPVAIHAGLGPFVKDNDASRALRAAHGSETPTTLHFGAIIGVVDLVDVHQDRIDGLRCRGLDDLYQPHLCSPWAMPGHHHLVLANPRPLAQPIPWRGQLGLWNLPDDVVREVAA